MPPDLATAPRLRESRGIYEASPAPVLRLAEPPADPLNESELSWIWGGQRFPPQALALVDGRPLRVLNPGRPGGGAGPDYLDAVLELGGRTVRGDVELHVRASAFRAHGHDRDAAYDNVALHVVFRADDGPATRLSNGASVPVAAFAPWLEGRAQELQTWLQAAALWQEPCREALLHLGEDAVRARLREAGLRRVRERAIALAAVAEEAGPDEALWRHLMDLIGVGGDRDGFRRLAGALPSSHAAAILAAHPASHAAASLAGVLVWLAALQVAPAAPAGSQGLSRLSPPLAVVGRPANHPSRRLAGVAALLAAAGGSLSRHFSALVTEASDARSLLAALHVPGDRRGALIGPDRARELALNLVLPFALLRPGLETRSLALLEALPAGPVYGKTAFLEANLLPHSGRRLVRTALEQQGLLSYLGEWCSRGGCGRCNLSPRT